MKTQICTFVCLVLNLSGIAQDKPTLTLPDAPCSIKSYRAPTWFDGFIVLDGGDTIRGKMIPPSTSYEHLNSNDYYMPFVSEKTCEMNFKPYTLRCFQYLPAACAGRVVDSNEIKSLKLWRNIYKYPYNDHAPFDYFITVDNDIDPNRLESKIFVQELRAGRGCSVYGFEKQTTGVIQSVENRVGFKSKCFLQKADGSRVVVDWVNFKQDMTRFFNDCPVLVQKIEAKEYTYKNWADMVDFYNSHASGCTPLTGH